MAVTPTTLKALYPWFIPDRTAFPSDVEYNEAIGELDAELNALITLYTPFISQDYYRSFSDLALSLLIAHHKRVNDEECLRVSTALKQLETGSNLSLKDVFNDCGCSGFLNKSPYGQQLEEIKTEIGGFSMFVIE